MSTLGRPCLLVPAIAIAALELGGGCVSAFTDGASDWTPADGKPTCRPEAGIAVDTAILALGVYAITQVDSLASGCVGGPGACLVSLSLPFVITGSGAIGVGGGVYKSLSCFDARLRWNASIAASSHGAHRDETSRPADISLDELARELGGVLDVDGDTFVLRAPNVDVCTSPGWRHQVRARRYELGLRGFARISCRIGEAVVWEGPLEDDD